MRETVKNQPAKQHEEGAIRIGISACLLGEKVRFDGQHKRDAFINDVLATFVEFVPVCPEVDIGLGIPRESIRLVLQDDTIHLRSPKSGADHTQKMRTYAARKARELAASDLSGYILKKGSPSCGMERVRIYHANGNPFSHGSGLFAQTLMEKMPTLPVEEEGRLHDPRLRENFYERVFAYRRLRNLFGGRWSVGDLVRFHTAEKLLLMAHDPATYRLLGRLVAEARQHARGQLASEYQTIFMRGLEKLATTRKHCNVLQHILGYFKKCASDEDRRELHDLIEDFRAGLVPLIVPITIIRHLVRRYGIDYLRHQTYLEPHPKELMLRNHV